MEKPKIQEAREEVIREAHPEDGCKQAIRIEVIGGMYDGVWQYGLRAVDREGGVLARMERMSVDRGEVERIAARMRGCEIAPVHLYDVMYDLLLDSLTRFV